MWTPEYRSFLQEWGRYTWLCGEIRWAVGLDSPRARELYAAEAVLAARVRGITPYAYDKMGPLRIIFGKASPGSWPTRTCRRSTGTVYERLFIFTGAQVAHTQGG